MRDEDIISLILKGEAELFSVLIDRYGGKVFSTAYSYTHNHEEAKDLVQEIFIKVYNSLERFRLDSRFSTWLYRIAVNSCIDWNRRNSSRMTKLAWSSEENDILDNLTDESAEPEKTFLRQEHQELLRAIVKDLPEIYKTVLILYYFEELHIQEISTVLDCPGKTVETRLYRARNMLKAKLKQELSGGEQYELQGV